MSIKNLVTTAMLKAALKKQKEELAPPVGTVISFDRYVEPATIWGGVWERIYDRFLYASHGGGETSPLEDAINIGDTGGSADAVVVAHNGHLYEAWNVTGNANGAFLGEANMSVWGENPRGWNIDYGGEYYPAGHSVGEDGTGKNMPPYLGVCTWKRIE